MMQSLTCVAPSNPSSSSLSTICSEDANACKGTEMLPQQDQYGAYSMCNATEQASWMYNQYYLTKQSSKSACSQIGGRIRTPAKTLASDCSILLRQAGTAGTGSITTTPAIPQAAATDASSGSRGNGGSNGNLTQTLPSSVGNDRGGLSTGAKAGIGISVAAAVLIILALAFLLWRQRRKNVATNTAHDEKNEAAKGPFKPELDGTSVRPREIDGAVVAGAHGYYKPTATENGQISEVGEGHRYEMPAVNADPAELAAPHGHSEAGVMSPAVEGGRNRTRL